MNDNSSPIPPQDNGLALRVADQLEYLKKKGGQCIVAGFRIGDEIEVYSLTISTKGRWAEDAIGWFGSIQYDFRARINQPDKPLEVCWLGHRLNWIDGMMFSEAVERTLD